AEGCRCARCDCQGAAARRSRGSGQAGARVVADVRAEEAIAAALVRNLEALAAGVVLFVCSWPVAAGLSDAVRAQSADVVTLEQLLERAGAYVGGFGLGFAT